MSLSTGGRHSSPENAKRKNERKTENDLFNWVDVPYGSVGSRHPLHLGVLHPGVDGADGEQGDGEAEGQPDHDAGDEPHQEDPKEGDGQTCGWGLGQEREIEALTDGNSCKKPPSTTFKVRQDVLGIRLQIQDVDD